MGVLQLWKEVPDARRSHRYSIHWACTEGVPVSDHTSVNMLCATCNELWPCPAKREEVINMLVGAHGLYKDFADVTNVPKEVQLAWKAYTNSLVKHYKITYTNGQWRMELINE
jgi:hypothetical protein